MNYAAPIIDGYNAVVGAAVDSGEHAGTQEDPIPYDGNMALENGKYYIQNETVYKCTRDTEIPVYQTLAELIGIYVEVATEE